MTVLSPLPEAQVSGSAVTVEVSASAASGHDIAATGLVLKNYGVPVSGTTVTRHTDPANGNHPTNRYTISWTGVTAGYYRLSVTATDSAGVPNTSAEQWLTVGSPGVPTPVIQQIGTFSNGPRAIAITDAAPETTIYYSVGYGGNDPGNPVPGASNTHKYTGPFVLYHGAAAVNAIAYHGNQQSALGHAAFDFQTKPLSSVGQNYGVLSRLPDAYYNTFPTSLPSHITAGVSPGVEIVTGKATLWGGVVGNEVAGWNLAYRSLESDQRANTVESEQGWTVLSSGVGSSDLAPLGEFDTSLLPNGQYELRLRVYNQNYDPNDHNPNHPPNYTDTFRTVIVSGGQKVGPLNLSLVDLTMPAPGFPIQLTRSYDSTDKTRGDFGIGWRLGISNIRVQTSSTNADATQTSGRSRKLGDGWKQLSYLGTYYLVETEPHFISISLPGGAVYAFYPKVTPDTSADAYSSLGIGLDPPTLTFVPVPGTQADRERPASSGLDSPGARLFAKVDGQWTSDIPCTVNAPGEGTSSQGVVTTAAQLWDADHEGTTLSVSEWMLQTRDGTQYYLDSDKGITQIVDRNGNTMTYDYVTAGDGSGNNRGYQVSAVHTFHSTSSGLQPTRSLTISRGLPHADGTYGYVTKVTDAAGNFISYTQDANENLFQVTNRVGAVTTYTYDRQHNLVTLQAPAVTQSGETGPLATIQPSVTNVYNDEGRLVATVDAANKTTVQSQFVAERRALVTDPLGHQSLIAYDDVGNVRLTAAYVTETDPQTNVTTTRVVQSTADYGFWSSSGSDGSGEAMSRFAGLKTQQEVQVDHDANGLPTFQTTKFTYDSAFGDLVTVSDPRDASGTTVAQKVKYNARGQVTEVDDPRVSTDPAQQVQQKSSYDLSGNLLSTQDALGNTTVYSDGDPSTTADNLLPDGSPRQVKDAAGNVTQFAYVPDTVTNGQPDPNAGQVKQITGPVVNNVSTVTSFTYKLTGEKETQTVYRQGQLKADGTTDDPVNLVTTFRYDDEGRMVKTISPQNQGNEASVLAHTEYNALGKVAARYDSYGRSTRYVYDVKGQLVKTVAPDGSTSQTQYDDAGRVTQTTASTGQISTTVYDALGRVSQSASTDTNGSKPIYTKSDYDDAGRVLATYDDRGDGHGWVQRSATTYDLAGNVKTSKDADAINHGWTSATYDYDAQGRNDWVQDARGFYTVYQFDALNRVTKTYFGATSTNTTALDATCAWTQTIYDSLGRKVEERTRENPNDPNDVKITAYHYDAAGRLDQVTQVMDTTTWLSTTDADPLSLRDPSNANLRTRYGYDSTGNKVWQQDAIGVDRQEANSTDNWRKTLFGYDTAGRMIWRKLPMGQIERMAYDNVTGRLLNTTDFNGKITTLHYFGIAPQTGTPSTEESVGTGDPRYGMLWEKQPDATLTDQVGIFYDYYTDPARKGRRKYARYGTDRTFWDYDARGRVALTDSQIIEPQTQTIAGPTRHLAYAYDIAGNKTGLTVALVSNYGQDSAFSLGYRYDDSDRMTEVWDTTSGAIGSGATQMAAYAYNPNGSLDTVSRGNGVVTTYRYNSRNELDWMAHTPPANNPQANLGDARAFVYQTDLSGKRTAMFVGNEVTIDGGGVPSPGNGQLGTRYTYDRAGRLTNEARADGTTTAWGYDRVGNRKTQTVTNPDNSTVQTTYNYDDNDRLTYEEVTTNGTITSQKNYTWNDNGQMVETDTLDANGLKSARYDYNFTGTLSRIRAFDSAHPLNAQDYVQFDYDADGHRLGYIKVDVNEATGQTLSQEVHRFTVDDQQAFAEVMAEYGDPSNSTAWSEQARYALGLDRLAMARPTGVNNTRVPSWYLYDGLGSTRALTDATGNLTDGYAYEAFGKPTRVAGTASTATLNAFLFNGQQFDGAVGGINGVTAGTGAVSDLYS